MTQFGPKSADSAGGVITYLEAGQGDPLVLLHGIGSGSASWLAQIERYSGDYRVVAWDAPGYGGSEPVGPASPAATDYAARLDSFLDALEIDVCHLVGHSLGAIMACGFTRTTPGRVGSLLIASPASGYGPDGEEIQAQRRAGRINLLESLGPEGLARERHGNLLSDDAPQWARDRVRDVMSRICPDGYRQAVELLVLGDIKSDAAQIDLAATVVVGGADTVTPPDGCRSVAESFSSSTFHVLPGLGHACYVEGPDTFNDVLSDHLGRQ